MVASLIPSKAVKETTKAIEEDTQVQTLERFRTKRPSRIWSGPIIQGS